MAFQAATAGSKCDMNVVPLIDVLLVLLIIFMVTVPMVSQQITIDLPTRSIEPVPPPTAVRLRIDAAGDLYWGAHALPRSALMPTLLTEAGRDPQATLEVETASDAHYALFAEVLSAARSAGMEKIGFVGH
jgi:biopolymer transport protein ExbD